MSLLAELRRRHVLKVGAGYLVIAWLAVQAASIGFPAFDAPPWALRIFILVSLLGFPVAVAMAWLLDATPEGLKFDAGVTGSKRVFAASALLVLLALGWYFRGQPAFRESPPTAAPSSVATVVAKADPKSIAVLPFVDMSQDKDQEYFSDGLSEELLNLLAQLPQLRVIARTSSFSFKGKGVDVATIARTLNVAHVLEGSVRKSGNTLRITAQLIRTSDSTHLWSQTFDRELTDVFKVQDEIAAAVVAALKVQLLSGQAMSNAHRGVAPEAYNQFLLADGLQERGNEAGWRQGIVAFEQAIALDPGYAAAYAGLAWSKGGLADRLGDEALLEAALAAASKAITLAPEQTDGYLARGTYRMSFMDWAGAQSDFEKALSLNPGESAVQAGYGRVMLALGRTPASLVATRKASELDPLATGPWIQLGRLLNASGQLPAAREALERAVQVNPSSDVARFHLGVNHLLARDARGALAIFAKHDDPYSLAGIAMAEHALRHGNESQQALGRLISESTAGAGYQIAEVHAWRGDKDQAFAWLDRAVAHKDGGLRFLKMDPLLAPLRSDPRYAALLQKVGLPP